MNTPVLFGAIFGDIIGSTYEFHNIKQKDFCLFNYRSKYTDDTVMTIATAEALLTDKNYEKAYRRWGLKYPYAGYGGSFMSWLNSDDPKPYNSWGNGSAMRVSPVGFLFDNKEEVLRESKRSAECTHNHIEGIKGAQATAYSIYMALHNKSKEEIKSTIEKDFDYDLSRKLNDIRLIYKYDVSCQGTVPEALIAFLESDSYEDSIRNVISIGGDSDTLGAICGAISFAYYKTMPKECSDFVFNLLPEDMLEVISEFDKLFYENFSNKA